MKHVCAVIEVVGGTVMQTQVTVPNAHLYFEGPETPEHPVLTEEVEELLSPKTP